MEKNLQFGFDSCGALDLSSSTSSGTNSGSSSGNNSTKVSDEDSNSDNGEGSYKRKTGESEDYSPRKKSKSSSEEPDPLKKVINKRNRNTKFFMFIIFCFLFNVFSRHGGYK